MASTYVNDLRLNEMATGDQSGSWGTVTNTNLELIAEAFSFGTEGITTNADTHTTTIADGATDPGRSMFLKYTGTLDSACTITIAPNTVSKLWFIENGTSGSQNIIISQGSGANITIPAGDTKAIYSDGAGSGAAMVDAFASLSVVDLKVQDDLTVTDDVAIGGLATVGGTLGVTGIATFTDDIIIGDGKTIGSASDVDAITIASNGQVTLTQTLIGTALDISGDIDVDGTTNLDVVDIDGAVQLDATFTVGANDQGYDVTLHGDTAARNVVWDSSADSLIFSDNAKAIFGAGSDLQIYHDGSHSYIKDNGTGDLILQGSDQVKIQTITGETMVSTNENNAVVLYYDNASKLATTSTGIDVTGAITADGLTVQNVNDTTTNTAEFRNDNGNRTFRFAQNTSGDADLLLEKNDGTDAVLISTHGDSYFIGGSLMVGKTSLGVANLGFAARYFGSGADGGTTIEVAKDNATVMYMNRTSSDGTIIDLRKDGTTVGSIGTGSSRIAIGSGDTFLTFAGDIDAVYPASNSSTSGRDNAIDIGTSGTRFDDIYATNGTIQTSDANEKQDIASLTSAEMLVGKRISALFKTFRWRDKVAAKGNDARTHTGIIAQDVQAAFTAESLDAGDYSLFISSTWWEHDVDVPAVEAVAEVTETTTDEDGNDVVTVTTEAVEAVDAYTRTDTYDTEDEAPEGATSKTRMGIRYPELLSFVAAYNEQRFAAIETRLAALEG
jgi:hypothetical protein